MNKIDIDNRTNNIVNTELVEKIVNDMLEEFGIQNSFLEIIFVGKDDMSNLNTKYRSVDKPTDVLSFPQPEIKEAPTKILGSIAISPEVTDEKEEDLSDVIKHGLLHLLGFDHEEDENVWQEAADRINCKL